MREEGKGYGGGRGTGGGRSMGRGRGLGGVSKGMGGGQQKGLSIEARTLSWK